ncbi:SHOCT domain-containing protein [Halomonas shantousis]
MQRLTPQGQAIAEDLARRHGFSVDAVTHMMFAVFNGNGGMAQFSHPEFGGSGQWMRGGMLMLSDMFNHALKERVDAVCHEIADIFASQPGLLRSGGFQSQSQNQSSAGQPQSESAVAGHSSLFASGSGSQWWPAELGVPNATGAQNDVCYAYFGDARRLAVQTDGKVWIYDTLDHRIGGFSQQQGAGGSITFSSQYGNVDLASLPVVCRNDQPVPQPARSPGSTPSDSNQLEESIFSAIERLGDLRAKGILSDEEFAAKKAELLGRL